MASPTGSNSPIAGAQDLEVFGSPPLSDVDDRTQALREQIDARSISVLSFCGAGLSSLASAVKANSAALGEIDAKVAGLEREQDAQRAATNGNLSDQVERLHLQAVEQAVRVGDISGDTTALSQIMDEVNRELEQIAKEHETSALKDRDLRESTGEMTRRLETLLGALGSAQSKMKEALLKSGISPKEIAELEAGNEKAEALLTEIATKCEHFDTEIKNLQEKLAKGDESVDKTLEDLQKQKDLAHAKMVTGMIGLGFCAIGAIPVGKWQVGCSGRSNVRLFHLSSRLMERLCITAKVVDSDKNKFLASSHMMYFASTMYFLEKTVRGAWNQKSAENQMQNEKKRQNDLV